MKKILFLAAFAVFGFTTVNAQDTETANKIKKETKKLINEAKTGGFKVGANLGIPLGDGADFSNFNFGGDVSYLFEVAPNLEVGALLGVTLFVDNGDEYHWDGETYTYDSNVFMPITATGRYYFDERKFFGGLDLGYAVSIAGDAEGGFYFKTKFGYNLGFVSLIASYSSISSEYDYFDGQLPINTNFGSFNIGAEINL